MDSLSDSVTGDVGQDMGLWTMGVTLGLVTWDRTWDCGQWGDIGSGDLGQDMGLWTLG